MPRNYIDLLANGGFRLDDDRDITRRIRESKPKDEARVPYMTSADQWENYNDTITCEAERKFREWAKTKLDDKQWCGNGKPNQRLRRYTFGQLWEICFGFPFDSKTDMAAFFKVSKVFAHYSSKLMKGGHNIQKAKRTKHTVYCLSVTRIRKAPPFCLKLRVAWLAEQGRIPNVHNMQVYPTLEAGHARNPRTEANMRKRSDAAKKRHNERFNCKEYRDRHPRKERKERIVGEGGSAGHVPDQGVPGDDGVRSVQGA